MPVKGFKRKRDNIIDVKFHKEFVENTGINIDYKTFKSIIVESNKEIANVILEGNDGFSLPINMGLVVITSYSPKQVAKPIDWKNSNKFGKRLYHHNLATFNKMIAINWYRIDVKKLAFAGIYKFKACRSLSRAASTLFKKGKDYQQWTRKDYYDANRLERMLLKSNKNN